MTHLETALLLMRLSTRAPEQQLKEQPSYCLDHTRKLLTENKTKAARNFALL